MKHSRRGITIIEAVAGSVILAALMMTTVQMLAWQAAQRRALDSRQLALAEASRILDRLTWEPWDRLTPERVQLESFSPLAAQSLKTAALKVSLHETTQDRLQAKRLRVEITWPVAQGSMRPVALVAWRYRHRLGAGT